MTTDDTANDHTANDEVIDEKRGSKSGRSVTDALATRRVTNSEHGVLSRLYHGETRADIVGRWKLWFAISGVIILVSVVTLSTKGLNLGIDFTGGTVWKVPAGTATVSQVQAAMGRLGYNDVQVQELTQTSGADKGRSISVKAAATAKPAKATTAALTSAGDGLRQLASEAPNSASRKKVDAALNQLGAINGPFRQEVPSALAALRSDIATAKKSVAAAKGAAAKERATDGALASINGRVNDLSNQEQADRSQVGQAVSSELAKLSGSNVSQVTVDTVGPSWGKQISEKARNALIVFLLAITLYITLRFEFRMAVATLAALLHDLVVVVGIYAVFGFPVTPATVIAILTILGFSIYDGIVVFDRVDENTGLVSRRSKMTYSDMANLSLNQVLMRSLNTSITALLPILSILLIGAGILGATTLEDFGLALFLGLMSGAYSSIFIATPILAILKEREPRYREVRAKLADALSGADSGDAGMLAGATAVTGGGAVTTASPSGSGRQGAIVDHPGPAGGPPRPRKQGKKR
jgi:preprotein translocase subunit SecF